ncbi:hypothetical protein CJA_1668 [Cellvibrio japonicus Ueda107]|uniref:Uncharacterized protein n=1 Tax=Cellvibrio japonicus (strain Ueda107) TaxID=498211 RepID=B3PEU3_CELJU|nr:hypothetical protein CJA_1668 [Cellvibrio japonicus Ueda107]
MITLPAFAVRLAPVGPLLAAVFPRDTPYKLALSGNQPETAV